MHLTIFRQLLWKTVRSPVHSPNKGPHVPCADGEKDMDAIEGIPLIDEDLPSKLVR